MPNGRETNPVTDEEREELAQKFAAGKDPHRVHNQLMIDWSTLERPELEALAGGLRWITWDCFEDDAEDPKEAEGGLSFGSGPVTDGTATDPDFWGAPLWFAEELADLCGLARVEDSTGVLSWGDFS